jgi:hypothetical protein
VVYRPAREQDLERAQELVVRSINDLTERHGFGPIAVLRPTQFQLFSLKDDPDGLWVAEDADETLGFAFSWVCGDLLCLSEIKSGRIDGANLRGAGWARYGQRPAQHATMVHPCSAIGACEHHCKIFDTIPADGEGAVPAASRG